MSTTVTHKPQINHKLCTHAATPYGRRQCRNHARTLPTLAAQVDRAYQDMMDANGAQPYNHAEYERCDRVLVAACMVYANGDAPYATALRLAFSDSGSDMDWYTTHWTRDDLVAHFGTDR
jgi:hypothetical protein